MKHYSTPHYLERRCRFRKSYGALTSSRRTTSQDRSFNLKSAWRRKSDPNNRYVLFFVRRLTKDLLKNIPFFFQKKSGLQ